MILLWIIASIQFGYSVEVSDVCDNTNGAILQAANQILNPDNETLGIIDYYLYCDNHHSNPLMTYINEAEDTITSQQANVVTLVQVAPLYGVQVEKDLPFSPFLFSSRFSARSFFALSAVKSW